MKKCKLVTLLAVIMLALPLCAEVKNSTLGLGIHAGTMTSAGYAMRYFSGKTGFQGTLGAYMFGGESNFNAGLNIIGVLNEFPLGRFYTTAGGSYRYYSNQYDLNEVNNRWTVGAGLGVELIPYKNFRIALEIPITYNWKGDLVMWYPMAGIYYYLK